MKRPIGRPPAVDPVEKIMVGIPASLIARLDAARGEEPRSLFARRAVLAAVEAAEAGALPEAPATASHHRLALHAAERRKLRKAR